MFNYAEQNQNGDVKIRKINASSGLLIITKASDGNPDSYWSSNSHKDSINIEWISFWFHNFQKINYIKLLPRQQHIGSGFPVTFKVNYFDGNCWQHSYTYIKFPQPIRCGWVILPLPATISARSIRIIANEFRKDDLGKFTFQLAEVTAGYDDGLEHLRFIGNNGASLQNEFRNVGSGNFVPTKIKNWNYDIRRPLISARPGGDSNIYAPSIVEDEGIWKIYFGGWDGTQDKHDRISLVSTSDFQKFSQHHLIMNNGSYKHVNNPSAIKISNNNWHMYYTTFENNYNTNKPAHSFGMEGIDYSPDYGTKSALINMFNYDKWPSADVNGSNVIYFENGEYYLYFVDFNNFIGVLYATSRDGVNFTFQGLVSNEKHIANDIKLFMYNSDKYYLMGFHHNFDSIFYSVSTDLTKFPPVQFLCGNANANDKFITSVGFVSDGKRLFGVLYGAGENRNLEHNAVYAAWLQKKVIFVSNDVRWGEVENALGPDIIIMKMKNQLETGRFYVYDTDGITLLYTSPSITIRSGDIWNLVTN